MWLGDTPDAYQEFYMVARGLSIKGVGLKCISLLYLSDLLQGKGDVQEIEYIKSCKALMIVGFTCDTRDQPISQEVAYRVEWFLRSWIYEGKSLSILTPVQLEDSTLWSKGFSSLFKKHLTKIYINVSRS